MLRKAKYFFNNISFLFFTFVKKIYHFISIIITQKIYFSITTLKSQMKKQFFTLLALFCLFLLGATTATAQKSDVRGYLFDKSNGQPIPYATVTISTTPINGATTDVQGFFNISDVAVGNYTLAANAVGFDSSGVAITVQAGRLVNQTLYMNPSEVQLRTLEVTSRKEAKRADVQVSVTRVSATQIKALPSTGGEPDLAQYLQVLPGVVFTGDQGGQLYIRGGSPIQNKIMIDGMTIYNPFHSIGFFSVFETETLRNVDVYTGGFGPEYGGRTSAVVDIQTREGNKKRFAGIVSGSPFQAKLLVEGPIVPLTEDGTSVSFMVTGKHSVLPQTSKVLYPNINPNGLPFGYTDGFAKISLNTKGGTRANAFGFSFNDNVALSNNANINWASTGGGVNFKIIPGTKTIISGRITGSDYAIALKEADGKPRTSRIAGFDAGFDFSNYFKNGELTYGVEVTGTRTDFSFVNALGVKIDNNENNTDLGGYIKYKIKLFNNKLILEPGLRTQYYASLQQFSPEPRLGLKWNVTDHIRLKAAGGYFSQNLISAVSERDIVNLFVGFLSSPDDLYTPGSTKNKTSNYLQTAWHAIGGVEFDVTKHLTFNVEPYYKWYPQLIALNRNKTNSNDPNFATEEGRAYGIDFSTRFERKYFNITANYSYSFVNRFDGTQTYPTSFDRRHNVNVFGSYAFGKYHKWELGARWNLGSGFPFTLTQGFYEDQNITSVGQNVLTGNGNVGVIYSDTRNGGRLPYYHRLDMSLKRTFMFTKYTGLDVTASVTNVYNRPNIFYFDRIQYDRVNQLPILPSIALAFKF